MPFDSSPGIDAAMDAPGVDAADAADAADGADIADVLVPPPDGSADGGISKGLCPTNGGPFDCSSTAAPVCCANTNLSAFVCAQASGCPAPYPRFNCTGPLQCAGGGRCCGGTLALDGGATAYTSNCYMAGTSCSMLNGMDTICGKDDDCPLDKPHCTKAAVPPLGGHAVYACEP
jgi:hypothetical protein